MNYHIIIAKERRHSTEDDPRELAIAISNPVEEVVAPVKSKKSAKVPFTGQLHTLATALPEDSAQLLYVAAEDGIVIKNLVGEVNMLYLGWSE